jgi:hypothetical protein
VTAGLFAAVAVVVLLVWSLRNVFVYVLLGIVALLVYWGLYLLVSSRLRSRSEEKGEGERRGEGE